MSAYTVLDSVNKYRHGVLVGNFVEDKFGKDLYEKVRDNSHRDPIQMPLKSLPPRRNMTWLTLFTNRISSLPVSSLISRSSTPLLAPSRENQ